MKKILSIALIFILMLMPYNAFAIEESNFADTKVMLDSNYMIDANGTLYKHFGCFSETEYFPEGITAINEFYHTETSQESFDYVKKAVLPYTCKTVCTTAFKGASSELDLVISEGCKSVTVNQPYGGGIPTNIKSVKIPDSVEFIQEYSLGVWYNQTVPAPGTDNPPFGANPIEEFMIYCYKDSYAQSYAEKYGIDYTLLEPVLGDYTGDDECNLADLLRLVKYLAGEDVPIFERVADLDGDGQVNMKECLILKKYLAGYNI